MGKIKILSKELKTELKKYDMSAVKRVCINDGSQYVVGYKKKYNELNFCNYILFDKEKDSIKSYDSVLFFSTICLNDIRKSEILDYINDYQVSHLDINCHFILKDDMLVLVRKLYFKKDDIQDLYYHCELAANILNSFCYSICISYANNLYESGKKVNLEKTKVYVGMTQVMPHRNNLFLEAQSRFFSRESNLTKQMNELLNIRVFTEEH